ncbi:MAG: bifunctional transaldolase/phosoglucose isomerase [Dehalococcoidia bacterium]
MSTVTSRLRDLGQSIWLDYIQRGLIESGRLARLVGDGIITGVTSNPTIFDKAIAGTSDYEAALQAIIRGGEADPYGAFLALAVDDIRAAADALRPIYDGTAGRDGFVSLEVPPAIAHDRDATMTEAHRLFDLVGRPNVMIKVPGTPAGIEALVELIAAGVNVNVTLLFSVDVYERVAEGYIAGLERRREAGAPLDAVASVASFFVSRVDTAADAILPEGSPLRGRVAVANARLAYDRFLRIFNGARWETLARAGARVQRPLWASTGTKNPAYSDILYVQDLIARDTVNTVPEATLAALLDHLDPRPTIEPNIDDARRVLREATDQGIDLDAITARLLDEGLQAFARDFDALLDKIRLRIETAPVRRIHADASLGPLAGAVDARLDTLRRDRIVERIWQRDHTVWRDDPTELADRLGWLTVHEQMLAEADELEAFAREAANEGFTHAFLFGMGGSSLAAEVIHRAFGTAPGMLDLVVLDTTDPAEIAGAERAVDLTRTLFIVASKSGSTIETRSQLDYFWAKVPSGANFIAITDPGTGLEALASERGFRRVFANPPDIGGRYSALSYFGLVPAALVGADIRRLLWRANEMFDACRAEPARNPGAWLGAVLGEAAIAGRDKLTLVLPGALAPLGPWLEQLIAESTGKDGKGILPVDGEPLGDATTYTGDRLFVAIGDHPALDPIARAGHPVVRLPFSDTAQLGGEFARWQFATAVACHVLGVQPFDQPNVQSAKDTTASALAGDLPLPSTPPLGDLLATLRPGDYAAILAYMPRTPANDEVLQRIRCAIRDRYGVATTVGYGPRYLHSTGQLHKGGPASGVFVQVVSDDPEDLPIPGRDYTFGHLKHAQALGDLASLHAAGRRVARATMTELVQAVCG